jgi:heptosyltransferase I
LPPQPRAAVRGSQALKRLDRFVGIPAVWLAGTLSARRRRPRSFDRVGVLRTAAIGDTLLLTGPLRDLRRALPDADIVLITGTDNAGAGEYAATGVARHIAISVAQPIAAALRIRREKLDLLIDTGAWPRLDALLTALSAARYRVGFRTPGQHRHWAYDQAVEHRPDRHELDNLRALVAALGFEVGSVPFLHRVVTPASPAEEHPPFIVFHPWSGGFRGDIKEWPLDRWVELATRLAGVASRFVITASAAQAQRSTALAARMADAGLDVTVHAGASFRELAALLTASTGVVAVNTGVMHFAAQLGAPTISLEGPTPVRRWGPVGPRVASVVSPLPGCGYLHLGFEYDGMRADCMDAITVDAVEQAVRRLVAGAAEPARELESRS